jgi:hypothetical protein
LAAAARAAHVGGGLSVVVVAHAGHALHVTHVAHANLQLYIQYSTKHEQKSYKLY